MSNLNEFDLAKINETGIVMDYRLTDGNWEMLVSYDTEDGEVKEWCGCMAIDVGMECLINTYEGLIGELSSKEIAYWKAKENYNALSDKIIDETDFKALYGKNNADVRKTHVKNELGDLYGEIKALEWSINWLKNYIPFLRELVRVKERY